MKPKHENYFVGKTFMDWYLYPTNIINAEVSSYPKIIESILMKLFIYTASHQNNI